LTTETSEATFIDLNTPEYTELFLAAPVYRKHAVVEARQVTETEEISTVLADGTFETNQTVEPGQWVITNPGGEIYAIKNEKFVRRYESIGNGKYQSKGYIHAFTSPVAGPVYIVAPWGEKQFGNEGCLFGASILEDGSIAEDRYILGRQEFEDTYRSI
jgi:hypothetical protein